MEVDTDDKENSSAPAKKRSRDYNRTRLRPAIVVFEQFLDKLAASWKGKQIEESDKTGFMNFWSVEELLSPSPYNGTRVSYFIPKVG